MRLMSSLPFRRGLICLARLSILPWLLVVAAEAQTTVSKAEALQPEAGLVTDYWVRLGMVVILLLVFAGLSVIALKKFHEAMSAPTKGGLWLESHGGGLGGGLGGWRVSDALVYLIVVAFLGGLAIAAMSMAPTYPRVTAEAQTEEAPTEESSTDISKSGKTDEGDKAPEKDADQKSGNDKNANGQK
jgi:hypothetical protein